MFSNATVEGPALYVSTVSEPLHKILRYGRSLSFFDEAMVGTAVFYEDLGSLLDERGLPAFVERLETLITERRPAIVVIDSFKALHAFAREPSDFRWFLHDFAARLAASGASSFWVGETADLVGHPRPRHHAGRRLLARRLHPGGRPVGLRQDGDGPELHLRRRRPR